MTRKYTVVSLPKGTLVGFDRTVAVGRNGSKLERTYFLDRNDNGLDVGDTVFEFYEVKTSTKLPGALIYGGDNPFPRVEIRKRSLTSRDIGKYKAAFKRNFKKLVKIARAHRPAAKKVPNFKKGGCSAYWAIERRGRVVKQPILPTEKQVKFSPAVTLTTQVSENVLRKPRVRYDIGKPKAIDPSRCAAILARTNIKLPGRAAVKSVAVSAGGVPGYPSWLMELFKTNLFKSRYSGFIRQIGVDYLWGGNQFIHLGLKIRRPRIAVR